jgi:hypothetical protein
MHSYPLRFKTEATPADAELTVLDAEKNPILFRPKVSEGMAKGNVPCVIFTDKVSNQPLFSTLFNTKNERDCHSILSTGETIIGELAGETAHTWKVLDENGQLVATIHEKSAWKNSCLFQILSLPFDQSTQDAILKWLAPHRYLVTIDGKKVMELSEIVSTISDDYKLRKSGEFSERVEMLLLASLITTLGLKE